MLHLCSCRFETASYTAGSSSSINRGKKSSKPQLCTMELNVLKVLLLMVVAESALGAKKIHYIHWNRDNPMFRLDNTDHIVDVNTGNLPWEYDQVNIICPVSKPGVKVPQRHVIYSVSREEFDSCRITNPKPKIVAVCSKPNQLLYFTITFRSFSPTPGGLEFHPGQDYYFISTSSPEDLHRRVGGGCSTHNMKMIFKVSDNRDQHAQINAPRGNNNFGDSNELMDSVSSTFSSTTTTSTTPKPVVRFNPKVPNHRGSIYYYHPRDLIGLDNNSLDRRRPHPNDSWQKEALRDPNSSSTVSTSICLLVLSFMALLCV